MDTHACPACGYENMARAVFCFQCGSRLEDPGAVSGERAPGSADGDTPRAPHSGASDRAGTSGTTPSDAGAQAADGVAVVCLRCGTPNPSRADTCMGCGAALALPVEARSHDPVARAAAVSDVGRERENNEDRVGLWALQGIVLAMVADGMGGAVAGEEASRLVMEAIQADFLGEARGSGALYELGEEAIGDKLRGAVRRANRAIIQRAGERPEFQGMGTTITLALIRGRRVVVAHIGDSRAYQVTGAGEIQQITADHSFVEALLASGHITSEQAAVHPMRNVLYRALGQIDDLHADIYNRGLEAGDTLILCSDGLTRHVAPGEIASIAAQHDDPYDIACDLVALANQRGGEDNISAVVVRLVPAGEESDRSPGPDVVDDTEVGLFQAPLDDDDDLGRETIELPALDDDE